MSRTAVAPILAVLFSGAALAQPAPVGTLVDAGGYRVHLYCIGSGTPTVVVAGAGFSFDWALVQTAVAGFARICTYDPSGVAWSDPPPSPPTCAQRVGELYQVLHRASIPGPYVMVGYSIGALYARLYAHRFPDEIAGMVIVDHAFLDPDNAAPPPKPKPDPSRAVYTADQVDTPPMLLSQTPISIGIEDDENFARLPKLSRDLHTWAMSRHPIRPTPEIAAECTAAVGAATLGAKPLVVISTPNASPNYRKLQQQLLSLSTDSRQILADHSTHMAIVDQPDAIVAALRDVIRQLRK